MKEIKFTNEKTNITVNADTFMHIKTKTLDLDVLLKLQEQDYKQKYLNKGMKKSLKLVNYSNTKSPIGYLNKE